MKESEKEWVVGGGRGGRRRSPGETLRAPVTIQVGPHGMSRPHGTMQTSLPVLDLVSVLGLLGFAPLPLVKLPGFALVQASRFRSLSHRRSRDGDGFHRRYGEKYGFRRGRSPKKNTFFSSLEKECTTYFFTNFSEDLSIKDLWSFFAKIGVVGDVVVPPRRDVRGRLFSFVRFKPSEDGARLDVAVKIFFINNRRLLINKPKFTRGKIPLHGNNTSSGMLDLGATRMADSRVQPHSVRSGVVLSGSQQRGTWCDVVRNGQNSSVLVECNTKPPVIDFSVDVPNNLVINHDALVIADLEFGMKDSDATACLARNGVLTIQVIPLDSSKVVLKGVNFEDISGIFDFEESWWRSVFASFMPWSQTDSAREWIA